MNIFEWDFLKFQIKFWNKSWMILSIFWFPSSNFIPYALPSLPCSTVLLLPLHQVISPLRLSLLSFFYIHYTKAQTLFIKKKKHRFFNSSNLTPGKKWITTKYRRENQWSLFFSIPKPRTFFVSRRWYYEFLNLHRANNEVSTCLINSNIR